MGVHVSCSLFINRPLRNQIYGPEYQRGYCRLDDDIGPEHLMQALRPHHPGKGDDGKEQAVYRYGYGIGDCDPCPLRPPGSSSRRPELVDLGINQLGYERRQYGGQGDPHLQREEKLPGRLASRSSPVHLGRHHYHYLKVQCSQEVYGRRQPDGGNSRPLPQLLVDQIAPGEGEGIDEAGIHDHATEIGDLGGGDIAGQGEEDIQAAEDYACLGTVYGQPALLDHLQLHPKLILCLQWYLKARAA